MVRKVTPVMVGKWCNCHDPLHFETMNKGSDAKLEPLYQHLHIPAKEQMDFPPVL